MIRNHQPRCFPENVIAAVSSVYDGNMSFRCGDNEMTLSSRSRWLSEVGISLDQATLVQVTYDTDIFTRYKVVSDGEKGKGMTAPVSDLIADALVTTDKNHALFLPLADCAGAVVYDSLNEIMMMTHLGRHSIEQDGARASIAFLIDNFASKPSDLIIWISPSVGKARYPLENYDGRGLSEVAVGEFIAMGVFPENIAVSPVDTAKSSDYFSHSEYIRGNRALDGRFAIAAMMK